MQQSREYILKKNKNRLTDTENKLVVTSGRVGQLGGGRRDTNYWVWDRLKDVLYNMGNIANIP